MSHLASTLMVMGKDPATQALHDVLVDQGYAVTWSHRGNDVLSALESRAPDVVLIGPGLEDMTDDALLRLLRDRTIATTVPTVLLTTTPIADCGDALWALGIDDAIDWPTEVDNVIRRLRPTLRMSTMRNELLVRQAVTASFQETAQAEAPTPPQIDDFSAAPPSILVIGSQNITLASKAALSEGLPPGLPQSAVSASVSQCQDLFEAQRMLEEKRFDACVIEAGDDTEATLDLCLQIRRNPRLFNLPVIYAVGRQPLADVQKPLQMGASHVLPMPVTHRTLRFALHALIRRQRTRWAIRQCLSATRTPDVAAPGSTEAYSAAYLERYLDYRNSHAHQSHGPLAIVGFAFAGVEAIRHEFGAEAERNLLDQIAQWLYLLVRAEDLVTVLDQDRFCVTLPDTSLQEAQVVMHRIAGVISNTDFAVTDVYRVVSVWPYVHAIDLTSGATARSLIDTLSKGFNSVADFG